MVRARLHSVHLKQALCHVWCGRGRERERGGRGGGGVYTGEHAAG